uniref:Uncharacterized protein n=1 Tax=Oryza brachyantha TaxID=4533 RepID=J3LW76_ORYBR
MEMSIWAILNRNTACTLRSSSTAARTGGYRRSLGSHRLATLAASSSFSKTPTHRRPFLLFLRSPHNVGCRRLWMAMAGASFLRTSGRIGKGFFHTSKRAADLPPPVSTHSVSYNMRRRRRVAWEHELDPSMK